METIYCKCDICNLVNSFKIGLKDENQTNQEGKNSNAEFLLDQVMKIVIDHHEEANAKTVINCIV